MKKIASFALLAALLLSGTAGFAACGERTPSDSSDSVSQPDIAPNSVLLYDFEEYVTDVEPLILLNYFGKVTLNEDKQYVRNGSGSLRIVPEGCPSENSSLLPTLKFPMSLERADLPEGDISQLTRISAEVYNAQSEPVTMYTQLQFFGGDTANTEKHELAPGWNTVLVSVDAQVLGLSYDITNCKGLLFSFELSEQAPTLYVDDIILYKTQTPYTPMEITVDPYEICSFDKLYQQYVVVPNANFANCTAELSINTDLNYALKGLSLRVQMKGNDGTFQVGDSSNYSYTGFSLSEGFMEKVNMDQYDESMNLSFWVYNTGSSQQRLFIHFYNAEGERYASVTNIYAPAGEWYNAVIPLSQLTSGTSSTSYRNAGEIYINWEINTLNEDRVLYFDEFAVTGDTEAEA